MSSTISITLFLKEFITDDLKSFKELSKFIDFELNAFSEWEEGIGTQKRKLENKQSKLLEKQKSQFLSDSEEFFLGLDVNDLLSAEDEEILSFKQEVLEMLIIKIYAKSESLLKKIFIFSYDKNGSGVTAIGRNIQDWKMNYVRKLSVDLEALVNYDSFNCLRILNNSIKHNDGFYSQKLAKDIFNTTAFSVLPFFFDSDDCKKLKSKNTMNDFLKYTEGTGTRIRLENDDVIDLYKDVCDFFDDLNSKI